MLALGRPVRTLVRRAAKLQNTASMPFTAASFRSLCAEQLAVLSKNALALWPDRRILSPSDLELALLVGLEDRE